jgi:hypothetical protein
MGQGDPDSQHQAEVRLICLRIGSLRCTKRVSQRRRCGRDLARGGLPAASAVAKRTRYQRQTIYPWRERFGGSRRTMSGA